MKWRKRGLKLRLSLNLFVYGLFNPTTDIIGYIASNDRIRNELESSHLLGGIGKNYGKPCLLWPVPRPRFESRTY
jgi:hypothetical protein